MILRQIAEGAQGPFDIGMLERALVAADDALGVEQVSRAARDQLQDEQILGRREAHGAPEHLDRLRSHQRLILDEEAADDQIKVEPSPGQTCRAACTRGLELGLEIRLKALADRMGQEALEVIGLDEYDRIQICGEPARRPPSPRPRR
jgi:hypothetical protein